MCACQVLICVCEDMRLSSAHVCLLGCAELLQPTGQVSAHAAALAHAPTDRATTLALAAATGNNPPDNAVVALAAAAAKERGNIA